MSQLEDVREAGYVNGQERHEGYVSTTESRTPSDRLPRSMSQRAERKFTRLRDEWKKDRRPYSSSQKLAMHPAYQKIIGMGHDAVAFLLRELETNLDSWFWALQAITEEDPVPEQDRGDGKAMAEAWLRWARERGIQW